jgi:hypothetical protein
VSRGFDRLLLRSPGQRACYHFVLRTLLRSERHSLLLGAFVGFPLILAAQALSTADPKSCFSASIPCAVVLSVPLIISYCLLFGARLVFELPVDPRANWVFRLLLDARGTETVSAARKLMLTFVAPLVGGCLLLYVYRWGWTVGLLHTLVTSLWSVSLIEILLLKFRKVPFTCSYPPFRSNTIPLLLLCLLGFLVYAPLTSEAENWALVRPVRMLLFAPLLATVWWVLRHVRSEMLDSDRHVIFEQEPIAVLERLNLSDAE